MEWISVKTPPKKNGRYLVVTHGYHEIRSYANNLYKVDDYDFHDKKRAGWYDYDGEYGYWEDNAVTHWAELPELPKEEA